MRIWFIEIGESLPIEKDARLLRCGLFTKELSTRFGHHVTWWTSGFSHFKREHICNEDSDFLIDNVHLRVIKGIGYKKSVSIDRILHQRDFIKKWTRKMVKYPKPDLLVCFLPTIENAYWAVKMGIKYDFPVLVDIRDLWPDELVDLAPVYLRSFAKLLLHGYYRKMRYACQNATGITSISKRYHDYGLKFAKRGLKLSDGIFPLGYPVQKENDFTSKEIHWWIEKGVDPQKIICCFFGTIGNYFNLDTILKAAQKLKFNYSIQFVFCGTGQNLNLYRLQSNHIDSVFFPGFVDSRKISALMHISNIGLAPYITGAKMSLPNKVFEYMAGGLPILSSIQGEITQILKENNCGFTYNADSESQFIEGLTKLYRNASLRERMGRNGKKIFLKEYTTNKIVHSFNSHIIKVIDEYNRNRGKK